MFVRGMNIGGDEKWAATDWQAMAGSSGGTPRTITFTLLGTPKKIIAIGSRISGSYYNAVYARLNFDHVTGEMLNGQDDVTIQLVSDSSPRTWAKQTTSFSVSGNVLTLSNQGATDPYRWWIFYSYE